MSNKRAPEHKPLSFTTTLRNPARVAAFLDILRNHDGEILTNELIHNVVKELIQSRNYSTMYMKSKNSLKSVMLSEELQFTDAQLEEIVQNSPQKHKEAGFDKGWPSRFETWYRLCRELGFVYYEINQPIRISPIGHSLCLAYGGLAEDEDVSKTIQSVFLNCLAKYPSDNPFRRNANRNKPLILLMQVIDLLREDKTQNGAGIARKEIPFVLCWPDSDSNSLYSFIKSFRARYGYSASDDTVYEECLKLLRTDNTIRFKKSQIIVEYTDDFLRKVRITGAFATRGRGRFLDFNKFEIERIKYVLSTYADYREFASELEYFNYVGAMDERLIALESPVDIKQVEAIRAAKLSEVAAQYSERDIARELQILSSGRHSTDVYLSDIDEPTRLEFLTSIALLQRLQKATVAPNYAIDDEGNPTFTARGGIGDIEVSEGEIRALVEVTLMKNKDQAVREVPGIRRHLDDVDADKKFAVLVAPSLHPDTKFMIEFTKYQYALDIVGYTIANFCEKIAESSGLEDLLQELI